MEEEMLKKCMSIRGQKERKWLKTDASMGDLSLDIGPHTYNILHLKAE
jgi:hypothetical protein